MVARFFPVATNHQQRQLPNHSDNDSSSSSEQMVLLSGPPSSGKTSLLFQFALNSVVSSDHTYAVFICNRRKLENKPPYLSQSVEPSSDVLDRIHMKYVEDDEGIKKYFAAFHLHQTFPSAVVVDDFGDFFDDSICQGRYKNQRGKDLAIVRTLALCRDAIVHANERMGSQSSCKLLLSETQHGETPRLLFIYKRWIPSIFTTKGDGMGSFILKSNSSSSGSASEGTKAAKYSIALQYLVLEKLIDDSDQ